MEDTFQLGAYLLPFRLWGPLLGSSALRRSSLLDIGHTLVDSLV